MPNKKSIRLLNPFPPTMALLLYHPGLLEELPWVVGIALAFNLVVDSMVILLCFSVCRCWHQVKNKSTFLLKAWLFGNFVDILGSLFFQYLTNTAPGNYITYNANLAIIIWFTIIIIGFLIFLFNFWLGIKSGLTNKTALIVGAMMGILTAPWIFLIANSNY